MFVLKGMFGDSLKIASENKMTLKGNKDSFKRFFRGALA